MKISGLNNPALNCRKNIKNKENRISFGGFLGGYKEAVEIVKKVPAKERSAFATNAAQIAAGKKELQDAAAGVVLKQMKKLTKKLLKEQFFE